MAKDSRDANVGGAGYIITFFNDIESLTNSLASYSNVLASLKGKYPTKEYLSKLSDEERGQTLQTIYDARFWIIRSYVKFSALKKSIKEFETNAQAVDALHKELIAQPALNYDKFQEYVIELNKLFVVGVVSTLLTKAYDIYAQFSGKKEE